MSIARKYLNTSLATHILNIFTMTGCQAYPKNDLILEEERKALMIQQTPEERESELRSIIEENLDQDLFMDQSRINMETREIIPDRMQKD
jgi:hypothetical protein